MYEIDTLAWTYPLAKVFRGFFGAFNLLRLESAVATIETLHKQCNGLALQTNGGSVAWNDMICSYMATEFNQL